MRVDLHGTYGEAIRPHARFLGRAFPAVGWVSIPATTRPRLKAVKSLTLYGPLRQLPYPHTARDRRHDGAGGVRSLHMVAAAPVPIWNIPMPELAEQPGEYACSVRQLQVSTAVSATRRRSIIVGGSTPLLLKHGNGSATRSCSACRRPYEDRRLHRHFPEWVLVVVRRRPHRWDWV